MKSELRIKCPECKSTFNLDNALVNQFHQSIKEDLQSELKRRETELQEQQSEFAELSMKFENQKTDFATMLEKAVQDKLRVREGLLKDSIRKDIHEEKQAQLVELEKELQQKSSQLIEFNQTKAKLQRLSREFDEKEAKIHLQMEEKLTERINEMKSNLKEQLQMESFVKIKEKELLIESLSKKLQEAQQKASQGSMQAQGEAHELVLEELLAELHPTDSVNPIGKGIRGADCLQTVITQSGQTAGKILYESKNTKNWSDSFIKKLKQDNLLNTNAEILVIVSKSLPKDMNGKYALIQGVWVTSLNHIRDMSLMLRYGLLKTHAVIIKQSGKKDKMSMLYDYLTSDEFRSNFESILQGFTELQENLHSEKLKMNQLWAKRAKSLEQILASTVNFYGSIKGISGDSIPEIKMLEFPKAG